MEATGSRPPAAILVFEIGGDARCNECGSELSRGDPILMASGSPVCLSCADLDHLEFLARGDAALTRRATRHSGLHAVVLRWSRARKRYERQGILVEPGAIDRAEEECAADAERRAARRAREAVRRQALDEEHVAAFAHEIQRLYPACPESAGMEIARHACRKHSGRVGRSRAGKLFEPEAVDLAVVAHVRHRHTPYDRLLLAGWNRQVARLEVGGEVEAVLERWRAAPPGPPGPTG